MGVRTTDKAPDQYKQITITSGDLTLGVPREILYINNITTLIIQGRN